mgnify:CR=1 FL=1
MVDASCCIHKSIKIYKNKRSPLDNLKLSELISYLTDDGVGKDGFIKCPAVYAINYFKIIRRPFVNIIIIIISGMQMFVID